MPQTLAYSSSEKWPAEPELSESEGEAVLRIPSPPRWLNIANIIVSAPFLFSLVPLMLGLWLALKYLGFSGLISLASPVLVLDVGIILAGAAMISIEIWNAARFGNQGTELRAISGELRYRRAAFLGFIRTSIYRANQIVELRAPGIKERRGKIRMTFHIGLRRRFPIRRVMKTSDPSLPANVENAFRSALGMVHATDATTLQPKIE